MPFGLKNTPFELVIFSNDDEYIPINMIGQKMLPILEDEEGVMMENLDIVHKLDRLDGQHLSEGKPNPDLISWINKWNPIINGLVLPRTADPIYQDFPSASARAYFTQKI